VRRTSGRPTWCANEPRRAAEDPREGYHLEADLADNAIAYLRELRLSHPDRPFFLWYGSAAPHAPHQVPDEWIERFHGRFDEGWDAGARRPIVDSSNSASFRGHTAVPRPPWVEGVVDVDEPRRRLYAA